MRSYISTLPYIEATATRSLAAAVMLLAGLPLTVAAQQPDDGTSSWGLGVAVITSQKAYTGIDRDNKLLPILSYENRYIRLSGPELAVKLPGYQFSESNNVNFSIIGKYDFTDYKQSDAPILNGMADRDGGFRAGFKAEWQNSIADISAEYVTEVSGDSEGSEVNLTVEKTWHFAQHYMFTPRIAVSWQDKKHIDYYYGVRRNEVTAERAFYQGEAGMNIETGARVGYMFEQRHIIFLDVSLTSLATEIKDSPLVDRSTENRVFLGYSYRF